MVVARVPTVIWQGMWTGEEGLSLGRLPHGGPCTLGAFTCLRGEDNSCLSFSPCKQKPVCFQENSAPPWPCLVHRILRLADPIHHPRLQNPSSSLGSDVALSHSQGPGFLSGWRAQACVMPPSVAWSQLSSVLPTSHVGSGRRTGPECMCTDGRSRESGPGSQDKTCPGRAGREATDPISNHREQALGEQEME